MELRLTNTISRANLTSFNLFSYLSNQELSPSISASPEHFSIYSLRSQRDRYFARAKFRQRSCEALRKKKLNSDSYACYLMAYVYPYCVFQKRIVIKWLYWMYEFCHHVNRINGPRIDVFNSCKETIATSSRTMDTRLCWIAIDWLIDFLYTSFFRNRETAKRSRREYSASVPEIWYQKLWHGVARCCRRRWVFKRLFLVSTCVQGFARVPWCTARSSFRKTCFADKKK